MSAFDWVVLFDVDRPGPRGVGEIVVSAETVREALDAAEREVAAKGIQGGRIFHIGEDFEDPAPPEKPVAWRVAFTGGGGQETPRRELVVTARSIMGALEAVYRRLAEEGATILSVSQET